MMFTASATYVLEAYGPLGGKPIAGDHRFCWGSGDLQGRSRVTEGRRINLVYGVAAHGLLPLQELGIHPEI